MKDTNNQPPLSPPETPIKCSICGSSDGCNFTDGRIINEPFIADDWSEIYNFMRFKYLPFVHAVVGKARERKIMMEFLDCPEYYKLWLALYHVGIDADNLEKSQLAINNCREHRDNCPKCQEITRQLVEDGNPCLRKSN